MNNGNDILIKETYDRACQIKATILNKDVSQVMIEEQTNPTIETDK
jgi:hypothetical protein